MAVTTYFISYYKNDGSGTMDTEMEIGSFVLPAITNIPNGADWSRQGYSFLGWNEFSDGSGTTYQPGDSITPASDMDFYALWSVAPPDGVVVSYNGNDIATLNSTGSAVLATDGTFMADDVTITYTEPSPSLQSKNVSPTESAQSIEPDAGYDGLSRVNVGAISSIYVGSAVQRQSAQTITPTTTDQTIASGKYLTGTQTIKGDANLVAENIADGVTIFGVTGTHQGGGGGSTVNVGLVDPMGAVQEIYYVDGNGYHTGHPQLDEEYVPRWSADVPSPSIVAMLVISEQSPSGVSNMTFQTRIRVARTAPADVLLYSV